KVNPNRKRKSLGKETTLQENVTEIEEMIPIIEQLVEMVSKRLKQQQLAAKCVVVKVKYADFTQLTRRITLDEYTNNQETIFFHAKSLLHKFPFDGKEVRLLGVTAAELTSNHEDRDDQPMYEQLTLF